MTVISNVQDDVGVMVTTPFLPFFLPVLSCCLAQELSGLPFTTLSFIKHAQISSEKPDISCGAGDGAQPRLKRLMYVMQVNDHGMRVDKMGDQG